MNPQLNKVFSKLAKEDKKTKLASEKVELGAIQDLDKLNSKIEKSIKEFNKAIGATKKAIDKAKAAEQKMFDNAENEWEKVDKVFVTYDQYDSEYKKLVQQIAKMAKDLGLDVKNVKQLQSAKKLFDELDTKATELDSTMGDLTRYFTN